ncbi:twitching motility protein PilT [Spirochaetia bacterium]|nr:twitching motility protein PilT [Spirochaetia bacterium]
MRYLLDTHILLWSFFEPKRLSSNVQAVLLDEENVIYYSPISLWEISIKYSLGKLNLKGLTPEEFYDELDASCYLCHDIENRDIVSNYHLPFLHKDPFDRFLIWEALQNGLIFITVDESIDEYKSFGLKIEK